MCRTLYEFIPLAMSIMYLYPLKDIIGYELVSVYISLYIDIHIPYHIKYTIMNLVFHIIRVSVLGELTLYLFKCLPSNNNMVTLSSFVCAFFSLLRCYTNDIVQCSISISIFYIAIPNRILSSITHLTLSTLTPLHRKHIRNQSKHYNCFFENISIIKS